MTFYQVGSNQRKGEATHQSFTDAMEYLLYLFSCHNRRQIDEWEHESKDWIIRARAGDLIITIRKHEEDIPSSHDEH